MITEIRIDGFKSFLDFSLDVPPTLIMLGPNAAGKSNLLDALRLVAGTVANGLDETMLHDARLEPGGLFHRRVTGDERSARDGFVITVGALVPSADGPLPLRIRLTAERQAGRKGRPDRVVLRAKESAVWVSRLQEREWMGRVGLGLDVQEAVVRARSAFLARTGTEVFPIGTMTLGPGLTDRGNEDDLFEIFPGGRGAAELFSLAARECATWRPLVLDPAAMRRPAPAIPDAPLAYDGGNLPIALDRIAGEAPESWRRLVADLAGLVSDVRDVRTAYDKERQELDFTVDFAHTGPCAPPALSDGTLRMLALLAAVNDPLRNGTLCVEEIENGMHPTRVADLVRRLRRGVGVQSLTPDGGYHQLIATTHSPALLAALQGELTGSLVFLEQVHRVEPVTRSISRTTAARPLRARDLASEPGETVSPAEVARLLRRLGQGAA